VAIAFVTWAMVTNRFFSSIVRIQRDRGHIVCDGGPYRWVRHPGYAGGALAALATPLALGSWWAFVPAVLTILLTAWRTALEDRTLQQELPGYAAYTQRTRYRLLPGVW
jgi:protein-S-isoprenylcysteine O-methyltransferase Ste14